MGVQSFSTRTMKRKVLILGGTGMLGHALFKLCVSREDLDAYAAVRSEAGPPSWLKPRDGRRWIGGVDAEDVDSLRRAIASVLPHVVINGIGLRPSADADPAAMISINALFPHRLARLCGEYAARMIHIGTDGVFDGAKGMYAEGDAVRISDAYGMTKYLGEVGGPGCVTLRTSIIGHELTGHSGLVDWFLREQGPVRGFARAVYSGFPTPEFARIVADFVIPREDMAGVYHVSSEPISKYELLRQIADRYGQRVAIERCDVPVLDRSLDSSSFRALTGYRPPSWPEMIRAMHADFTQYRGSMYV
jgi:dTDP-4-dehydrorhamnose reductase